MSRLDFATKKLLFRAFVASWKLVDKTDYRVFTPSTRERQVSAEAVVAFLLQWLEDDAMRHDYKELIELTILYLGGVFPPQYKFTFKAPGAFHHARWMSKIIYTLKYALFGHQVCFSIDDTLFTKIKALASFLAIYYVKEWCTCTSAADAPINDLAFYKRFSLDLAKVKKSPTKFPAMYSQFLSQRLVIIGIFSNQMHLTDKVKVWKALKKMRPSSNSVKSTKGTVGNGLQ